MGMLPGLEADPTVQGDILFSLARGQREGHLVGLLLSRFTHPQISGMG